MTDTIVHRPTFRTGLAHGALLGLLLGVPAGVVLKVSGYPTDELYAWWLALAAAWVLTLVVAIVLAPRRGVWAGGLFLGATAAGVLAPALVVIDILVHSA